MKTFHSLMPRPTELPEENARTKSVSVTIASFTPSAIVPLSLQAASQVKGGTTLYSSSDSAANNSSISTRQKTLVERYLKKTDWSESLQAVLEQPPARLSKYLMVLGFLFSGAFVAWAFLGHIQEVSHAQGKLSPQGETYKIQPVIQGQVESILVEEGDRVRKEQLLLSLDSKILASEVQRLEQAIVAAQTEHLEVRSLIAQTQQEEKAQSKIAAAAIQLTAAALQEAQAAVATSEDLIAALRSEMTAQQERLDRISTLETQGAISQEYLFGIEQGVREQQQAITQNEGQLEQIIAQTQQSEAELAQKQAEEQQIHLSAQQAVQKLIIEEQQLQANIIDLETQLSEAKEKLAQSTVKAPIDGTVSNVAIDNVGEVVQPGQMLAEVVPADTPLILSAMVPHQEAGLLKIGMETQIKMHAFPYQDYGILSGKVISISPDAKVDGQANSQTGEQATNGYRVNVSLDKDFVVHERQKVNLQIGQTASAEIVVRRRRIIDLLLDPIRQLTSGDLSL
ncbi:MAG: HlyD family efflux transporter periplasmic adaptor subunit [Phormidesmis sp.]